MKKPLAILAAVLAFASPAKANVVEEHIELLQTVENKGVQVLINNVEMCSKGQFGSYISRNNGRASTLLICQENRSKYNDNVVPLTWEDADTIRHEVWHMVQDCVDGGMGDAELTAVQQTAKKVVIWARKMGASDEELARILGVYEDAPHYVQVAEVEAFTVASKFDAPRIQYFVQKYCTAL